MSQHCVHRLLSPTGLHLALSCKPDMIIRDLAQALIIFYPGRPEKGLTAKCSILNRPRKSLPALCANQLSHCLAGDVVMHKWSPVLPRTGTRGETTPPTSGERFATYIYINMTCLQSFTRFTTWYLGKWVITSNRSLGESPDHDSSLLQDSRGEPIHAMLGSSAHSHMAVQMSLTEIPDLLQTPGK